MQAEVLYSAVSVLLSRYCSAPGFYVIERRVSIIKAYCGVYGVFLRKCFKFMLSEVASDGFWDTSRPVAEMLLHVEVNLI